MSLTYQSFFGKKAEPYFDEIASLRMTVFRDFPYLYDGSLEYEKKYLNTYANSADFFAVLAFANSQLVGVSTALPLAQAEDSLQEPFLNNALNINDYYYFGESVLLTPFRGQGAGHYFFSAREQAGRELGYRKFCFCAVERSHHHPQRPADYQELGDFWAGKGFKKHDHLQVSFAWKEVGEEFESQKPMRFWLKESR